MPECTYCDQEIQGDIMRPEGVGADARRLLAKVDPRAMTDAQHGGPVRQVLLTADTVFENLGKWLLFGLLFLLLLGVCEVKGSITR